LNLYVAARHLVKVKISFQFSPVRASNQAKEMDRERCVLEAIVVAV
jgi:hypothetical protein